MRCIRTNYPGFRNGPVPYTGGWGRCEVFRKIRTTQERRENCSHPEYVRPKRRMIPNSWDDIMRGDYKNNRCWKNRKKRKQWMK